MDLTLGAMVRSQASALPLLVSYFADNTGLGFRAPIRAFSSSVDFRISQIAWGMEAQAGVQC